MHLKSSPLATHVRYENHRTSVWVMSELEATEVIWCIKSPSLDWDLWLVLTKINFIFSGGIFCVTTFPTVLKKEMGAIGDLLTFRLQYLKKQHCLSFIFGNNLTSKLDGVKVSLKWLICASFCSYHTKISWGRLNHLQCISQKR